MLLIGLLVLSSIFLLSNRWYHGFENWLLRLRIWLGVVWLLSPDTLVILKDMIPLV